MNMNMNNTQTSTNSNPITHPARNDLFLLSPNRAGINISDTHTLGLSRKPRSRLPLPQCNFSKSRNLVNHSANAELDIDANDSSNVSPSSTIFISNNDNSINSSNSNNSYKSAPAFPNLSNDKTKRSRFATTMSTKKSNVPFSSFSSRSSFFPSSSLSSSSSSSGMKTALDRFPELEHDDSNDSNDDGFFLESPSKIFAKYKKGKKVFENEHDGDEKKYWDTWSEDIDMEIESIVAGNGTSTGTTPSTRPFGKRFESFSNDSEKENKDPDDGDDDDDDDDDECGPLLFTNKMTMTPTSFSSSYLPPVKKRRVSMDIDDLATSVTPRSTTHHATCMEHTVNSGNYNRSFPILHAPASVHRETKNQAEFQTLRLTRSATPATPSRCTTTSIARPTHEHNVHSGMEMDVDDTAIIHQTNSPILHAPTPVYANKTVEGMKLYATNIRHAFDSWNNNSHSAANVTIDTIGTGGADIITTPTNRNHEHRLHHAITLAPRKYHQTTNSNKWNYCHHNDTHSHNHNHNHLLKNQNILNMSNTNSSMIRNQDSHYEYSPEIMNIIQNNTMDSHVQGPPLLRRRMDVNFLF